MDEKLGTGFNYNEISKEKDLTPDTEDIDTNEETINTPPMASNEEMVEVTAHKLYLRKQPTKKSEVVTILKRGMVLVASGFEGKWLTVETETGLEGYVMKQFVKAV